MGKMYTVIVFSYLTVDIVIILCIIHSWYVLALDTILLPLGRFIVRWPRSNYYTAHYYTAQNEPQECTVTSWSEWGQCGVTCGAGKQGRKRTVVDFGDTVDGVNCVKSLSEIRDCNPGPCPGKFYCLSIVC